MGLRKQQHERLYQQHLAEEDYLHKVCCGCAFESAVVLHMECAVVCCTTLEGACVALFKRTTCRRYLMFCGCMVCSAFECAIVCCGVAVPAACMHQQLTSWPRCDSTA
jgi:hypothetical protein